MSKDDNTRAGDPSELSATRALEVDEETAAVGAPDPDDASEAAEVTATIGPTETRVVVPDHTVDQAVVSQPRVNLVTNADFEQRSRAFGSEDAEGEETTPVEAILDAARTFDPETDGPVTAPRKHDQLLPAEQRRAMLKARIVGRGIDAGIFVFLAWSYSYLGPLIALLYVLFADGLIDGASVGKLVTRQRVRRTRDERAANPLDSLLRNAPLGLAALFSVIPFVGWILFLTLGVAILLFESYMVWQDPRNQRAGDILAGTHIIYLTAGGGGAAAPGSEHGGQPREHEGSERGTTG